jgi:hypothetical protein
MEIELKKPPKIFKPIEMSVVFETEEEYRAVYRAVGYNITLAGELRDKGYITISQYEIVKDFFGRMHSVLLQGGD